MKLHLGQFDLIRKLDGINVGSKICLIVLNNWLIDICASGFALINIFFKSFSTFGIFRLKIIPHSLPLSIHGHLKYISLILDVSL